VQAVAYRLGDDLRKVEQCRLFIQHGKVVASGDPKDAKFLLNETLYDYSSAKPPYKPLTAHDGEEWLWRLPAAFHGSYFWVELDDDAGNPIDTRKLSRRSQQTGAKVKDFFGPVGKARAVSDGDPTATNQGAES
jgi:hypothetical protein